MKCKARIMRTFKIAKADVAWPNYPEIDKYPEECGGDISLSIELEDEPYYGGCSTVMVLKSECTRCKAPWWDTRAELEQAVRGGCFDLTPYVKD